MALEGRVWKFEFAVNDRVTIDMPEVIAFVGVGTQRPGHICIWAVVRPETQRREVTFHVRGTGHPVPLDFVPLGLVFDGTYVWHVFRQ